MTDKPNKSRQPVPNEKPKPTPVRDSDMVRKDGGRPLEEIDRAAPWPEPPVKNNSDK